MGFDLYPIDFEWVRSWRYNLIMWIMFEKILVISIREQDLDKKAEILWLYQHKVHSSLVSIHSCKMVYWTRLSYNGSLIVCVLFFCLFRVCWLSIFDKYLLVLTEKLQRVWILQKGHNQRLLWLRLLQPIIYRFSQG